MSRDKPQVETLQQHPEPYQHDLNPNARAGQNLGIGEAQPAKQGRTAYDVKPVHKRLRQFSDDELKQLRILPNLSARRCPDADDGSYANAATTASAEAPARAKRVGGLSDMMVNSNVVG
jgi:hypothetical protein